MEENKVEKNKRKYLTVGIITTIIMLALGITLAVTDWTKLFVISGTSGCFTINYTKGQDVTSGIEVGTSYSDKGVSSDIVMYKDPACKVDALGTLYITTNDTSSIDFTTGALKYSVVVNDTEVSSGSVKGIENQVIYRFYLNDTPTTYKVYLWLDINLYQEREGDTYSGFVHAEAVQVTEKYEIHDQIDESGANYPVLVKGLIPVVYNETTQKWVKADTESSTSTYGWYDYTQKKWANAILVTDTNRATYQSASAGTEITDEDILEFYVWIPRYKYKVWNKDKVIGTDAYNARTTGIDIVFESGTTSTGTISCTYNFNVDNENGGIDLSTTTAETCTGTNGDYYTHPAFTFGDTELKGFWIGKFELSSETPKEAYGGGGSTKLTPRILPNVVSWRNNTIPNFITVIQNMQKDGNIYGLSTDKSVTDSHILTNMEWGAVAYLTNSNYGRCSGGACTEVTINNCNSYVTGIGGNTVNDDFSTTACTTDANKYNGAKGILASTTGNIYGVYDMSGGSHEFSMGNASSTTNTYTFNSLKTEFASNWYSNYSNQKYVITYANGLTNSDQAAYNRARLGDATGEVVSSSGGSAGGWYSTKSVFPYSNWSWLTRGGGLNNIGDRPGVFNFNQTTGGRTVGITIRAILVWTLS